MFMRRLTAYKLNIKDIVDSVFHKSGDRPDYVNLQDLKVSRVNLMGVMVHKFISDDGNYAAITLDDSTETIRCKLFASDSKEIIEKLRDIKEGELLDIVGRVREYNEEVYISPETLIIVDDPNSEIVRKLDITRLKGKIDDLKKAEQEEPEPTPEEESPSEDKLLELIDKGVKSFNDLMKESGFSEDVCKEGLSTLLSRGDIYEPKKGEYDKP
jgi:RPA family protein